LFGVNGGIVIVGTAADSDYDRVAAAVALRAVAEDDSLARRLADDRAARPQWTK
jgi:hypothetical protein